MFEKLLFSLRFVALPVFSSNCHRGRWVNQRLVRMVQYITSKKFWLLIMMISGAEGYPLILCESYMIIYSRRSQLWVFDELICTTLLVTALLFLILLYIEWRCVEVSHQLTIFFVILYYVKIRAKYFRGEEDVVVI